MKQPVSNSGSPPCAKMDRTQKLSNASWYMILCMMLLFAILLFVGVTCFSMLVEKRPLDAIIMEILPALVMTLLLFSAIIYFVSRPPISKRANKALAKIENAFYKELKKQVTMAFGKGQYFFISPGINQIDAYHTETIEGMLKETPSENKEMRCLLYATLGRFRLKNFNYESALEKFRIAAEQQPDSIICQTWLAETYELLGDAQNALNAYHTAALLAVRVSNDLAAYFQAQIDRIEIDGFVKSKPITGIRYMKF